MASMDNLRDKIRSRRADTSDLNPTPAAALNNHTFDDAPVSQSHTDSLISEIFADQPAPPSFSQHDFSQAAPKAKPEPKVKKPLELPFMNKFKHLEVNRKMLMISLGVAAVASILSMTYLNGIASNLGSQAEMIKVISLKKDVPARTELTEDMLEIKEVPRNYVPSGALVYEKNMKLLGQVTTSALYKGEIINKDRITVEDNDSITAVIPDKHRAMTVRTNNASLIHPSTRDRKEYIDLIASIPDPNPVRKGKVITYPILQRAMVLAVGDHLSNNDSKASSTPNTTITLAVPEDRVNLMVMLEEKGDFKVIPRAPGDESTQMEKYTVLEIEDALQGRFEAAPAATPEPKAETVSAPVREVAPAAPAAPLRDLSGGSGNRPAYRAPARTPVYRAPVRTPVYRAPARSQARPPARAAAPVRQAAPPAAPARARVKMPRMTIQGGSVSN